MELNLQQQEAIEYYGTPQIIIAGAGTGKTTVMIQKIKYLIETNKHRASSILALTFTNKAANEMKERFESYDLNYGSPTFGTFHSFCLRFLKQLLPLEGVGLSPGFTIIDSQNQKEIINRIIKNQPQVFYRKPKDYLSKISSIKQSPRHMHAEYLANAASDIQAIFEPYNQTLTSLNCVDFDDLLLYTHDILSTNSLVQESVSQQYEFVIIDEYQDTNEIQNELTILLSKTHQNVVVVGDFDQTIYSFRGAKIENLLQFNRQFSNCVTHKLEINYRSTHEILNSANQLIECNLNRQPKQLISHRKGFSKPQHLVCFDEKEEALVIAQKIKQLVENNNYDDFAVLYRTNQQARIIEETFISQHIPHRVVGSVAFYQRFEIKTAIAYLQCLSHLNQPLWFQRAMMVPPRGIGKTSLDLLIQFCSSESLSVEDALRHPECPLKPRYIQIAQNFVDFIKNVANSTGGFQEKLADIFTHVGFESYLKKQENGEDQRNNIKELMSKLADVTNLSAFLDEVTLFQGGDGGDSVKKVHCLTLHLAKGLEFPVVFIPGFEQDLMPLKSNESIEEERRLAYVGITRGKTQVYLLSAYKRTLMGDDWYHHISPFTKEMMGTIEVQLTAQANHLAKAMVFKLNEARIPFSIYGVSPIPATQVTMNTFVPGDIIVHPSLGTGTIQSTSGDGENLIYNIQFSSGIKKLMAKFAPIKEWAK
jgi:DNA helicase-2/ATP-dependent DNA helicase PcrA